MEFKLVCDIREDLRKNMISPKVNFSDHPPKENIEEIKNMIEQCGYTCSIFGGIRELIAANSTQAVFDDCIFLNLTDGLDIDGGRIQAPILLETLGVKYSGASPFQAALIDNKYYSELAVQKMNICVPSSLLFYSDMEIDMNKVAALSLPVIVKPNKKGSSVGITQDNVCFDVEHAYKLIMKLLKEFNEVIVEEFIPGYEVTNFIIGNNGDYLINTPVLEEFHGNMIHTKEVMAIEDKAYRTRTFHLCDDILGKAVTNQLKYTSIAIKETLRVNDILRIDYRVTSTGEIFFLEANTVPRISSGNEAGFISQCLAKPYKYFINCLLQTVINRCT